ncbi:conserved domain protein [Trichinella spiralis]|nr:conserved domain protein [Trichinella spiralis]
MGLHMYICFQLSCFRLALPNMVSREIYYSEKYEDEKGYEYRHVHLPKSLVRLVPRGRLMTESEWRRIGIQQSRGWEHYMIFNPEPHVILFRRKKVLEPVNNNGDENMPPNEVPNDEISK